MKCPNCSRDILDSAIICPYCNTQFAFSALNATTHQNPNLYEVVEQENVPMPSPNEASLPTEVTYNNEEEINPDEMTYYVDPNHDRKISDDEVMHIYGRPIEINQDVPIDPMKMGVTNPIRTEAPSNVNVQTQGVVQNQVNTPIQNGMVQQQGVVYQNNQINQGMQSAMNGQVQPQINGQVQQMSQPNVPQQNAINDNQEAEINQNTFGSQISNGNAPHTIRNVNTNSNPNAAVRTANLIPESGVINIEPRKEELYNTEDYLKAKKKNDEKFFMAVIIVGTVVLIGLIISMIVGKDKKEQLESIERKTTTEKIVETKNIGYKSTFNYPLFVGNTTVASYYDKVNKRLSDVDVYGIRFIEGIEAEQLAANYSKDTLIEGFEWYGFEYSVKFNDLEYLGDKVVDPTLDSKIYLYNGCDFVTYNEKNYLLKMTTIYDGRKIKNGESAKVKVVYQMPKEEKEYSVCFGEIDKTFGCFSQKR